MIKFNDIDNFELSMLKEFQKWVTPERYRERTAYRSTAPTYDDVIKKFHEMVTSPIGLFNFVQWFNSVMVNSFSSLISSEMLLNSGVIDREGLKEFNNGKTSWNDLEAYFRAQKRGLGEDDADIMKI